ncbi:acyltransferase [Ligilactobacillus saerimneri]|uniref:acyltransferase family protein n=1 Tax=Ligilactobacillus saerimneri TaxID=228229 RepID=UPI0030B88681
MTSLGKLYDYSLGDVGVEVFLFLSGMGLYFSLTRNSDIKSFYERRFKRILPTFIIVSVTYYYWLNFIYKDTGIWGFIRGEFFIDFFRIHDKTYWFILLILLMYLVFPYLYIFLLPSKKKRTLRLVLLFIAWLVLIIALWFINGPLFNNVEILLFRIPIFILGLFFAPKIMKDEHLTKYELSVLLSIFTLKLIFIRASILPIKGRIIAIFWAFPIMFMSVWLCRNFIVKNGTLDKFIKWTGSLSLELYTIHVSLREIFNAYGFSMAIVWHYMIMVVLTYIMAVLLKRLHRIHN